MQADPKIISKLFKDIVDFDFLEPNQKKSEWATKLDADILRDFAEVEKVLKLNDKKNLYTATEILRKLSGATALPVAQKRALTTAAENISVLKSDDGTELSLYGICHNMAVFGDATQKATGINFLANRLADVQTQIKKYSGFPHYFFADVLEPLILNPDKSGPGKTEAIEVLTNYFANARFSWGTSHASALCLLSRSLEIQTIGRTFLARELKSSFGDVNANKIISAWIASTKQAPDSLQRAMDTNMESMQEAEKIRPGAVKFLNEKFGICDFGRYPVELLVRQVDEYENTKIPYGVIVYPEFDDNGAFYYQENLFQKLFNRLSAKLAIRVAEVGDKLDITRTLHRLDSKYGRDNKISFAILGAHGKKDGMTFGNDHWLEKNALLTQDLRDSRAQKGSYFKKGATLILHSCNTGFKNGIGQELSKVLELKVVAPDRDTHISDIAVEFRKGNPKFRVKFGEKAEAKTYTRGNSAKEKRNADLPRKNLGDRADKF